MKTRLLLPLGILAVVFGIIVFSSLFTVHQTQQALVLQFGEPKRIITQPGLGFKLPFVQNVLYYERRVLNLDPPTQRVLLADQKPLLVDAFARYRIYDPLRFYQTVRTETVADNRLGAIVNAAMRGVLGNQNLASILSEERSTIMQSIRDDVNTEARRFGIDIIDVRIRRSDLPDETSQAVYARMRSEREREAAEFRAQGSEQAQRIRAAADREATVIRAEAEREAEIQRGEGEARRTRLLSEAFGRDPDFFEFYRSMQAYDAAIGSDNSLLVIPPDNEFFRYFNQSRTGLGSEQGSASR
jgi:membrane protease subunit HflC